MYRIHQHKFLLKGLDREKEIERRRRKTISVVQAILDQRQF